MTANLKVELTLDDKGTVKIKKFGDQVDKVRLKGGKFNTFLQTSATSLGKLGLAAGRVALKFAAMAATMGAGFGVMAIVKFAEFETALVDLAKVTDENLGMIRDRIMMIGPEFGTATEMAKGLYQVISAGVTDIDNAMETLLVAAKLQKTAYADMGDVVIGLTSVMGSFKVGANEAADALQTIEKKGKTSVQKLIPVLGEISAIASNAGLSLNQMGAAFATITLNSGGTEKAATQFKALIVSLLSPTKEMAELLGKYGGAQKAIKDLGFGGVMQKIKEQTGGSAEATKKLLGPVEAYFGFLNVSINDMQTYADSLDAQRNKVGAVDAAWQKYLGTLRGIWTTFKNTVGKIVIQIGEKLAPQVKVLIERFSAWIKKMEDPIIENFSQYLTNLIDDIRDFIVWIGKVIEDFSLWKNEQVGVMQTGFVPWLIDVAGTIGRIISAVDSVISAIGRMRDVLARAGEDRRAFLEANMAVNVEFTGEGSSRRPLTEKIAELTDGLTGFRRVAEDGATNTTLFQGDYDGMTQPLAGATDSAIDAMSNMRDYVEAPMRLTVNADGAMSAVDNFIDRMVTRMRGAQQILVDMAEDWMMLLSGAGSPAGRFALRESLRGHTQSRRNEQYRSENLAWQAQQGWLTPFEFSRGGIIPGYGGGDTVPAMLEPGEVVIPKEIVKSSFQQGQSRGLSGGGPRNASSRGQVTVNFNVRYMTGDKSAARNVAKEIDRELKSRGLRIGSVSYGTAGGL